ncbi:MAG: hypothetical protein LBN04_05805 [Oscillospiraceae bacterium]|jgi:hypothetical protein|nr:hypothetical protein [Oscillospiraceae bacterium]
MALVVLDNIGGSTKEAAAKLKKDAEKRAAELKAAAEKVAAQRATGSEAAKGTPKTAAQQATVTRKTAEDSAQGAREQALKSGMGGMGIQPTPLSEILAETEQDESPKESGDSRRAYALKNGMGGMGIQPTPLSDIVAETQQEELAKEIGNSLRNPLADAVPLTETAKRQIRTAEEWARNDAKFKLMEKFQNSGSTSAQYTPGKSIFWNRAKATITENIEDARLEEQGRQNALQLFPAPYQEIYGLEKLDRSEMVSLMNQHQYSSLQMLTALREANTIFESEGESAAYYEARSRFTEWENKYRDLDEQLKPQLLAEEEGKIMQAVLETETERQEKLRIYADVDPAVAQAQLDLLEDEAIAIKAKISTLEDDRQLLHPRGDAAERSGILQEKDDLEKELSALEDSIADLEDALMVQAYLALSPEEQQAEDEWRIKQEMFDAQSGIEQFGQWFGDNTTVGVIGKIRDVKGVVDMIVPNAATTDSALQSMNTFDQLYYELKAAQEETNQLQGGGGWEIVGKGLEFASGQLTEAGAAGALILSGHPIAATALSPVLAAGAAFNEATDNGAPETEAAMMGYGVAGLDLLLAGTAGNIVDFLKLKKLGKMLVSGTTNAASGIGENILEQQTYNPDAEILSPEELVTDFIAGGLEETFESTLDEWNNRGRSNTNPHTVGENADAKPTTTNSDNVVGHTQQNESLSPDAQSQAARPQDVDLLSPAQKEEILKWSNRTNDLDFVDKYGDFYVMGSEGQSISDALDAARRQGLDETTAGIMYWEALEDTAHGILDYPTYEEAKMIKWYDYYEGDADLETYAEPFHELYTMGLNGKTMQEALSSPVAMQLDDFTAFAAYYEGSSMAETLFGDSNPR